MRPWFTRAPWFVWLYVMWALTRQSIALQWYLLEESESLGLALSKAGFALAWEYLIVRGLTNRVRGFWYFALALNVVVLVVWLATITGNPISMLQQPYEGRLEAVFAAVQFAILLSPEARKWFRPGRAERHAIPV